MSDGKEELDELREAVRGFLTAKSPESAVRAAMEVGYDRAVLDQMARQLRLTCSPRPRTSRCMAA